ncbi:UDP-N-acetylglucosamine 2-epimerase [Aridibaculum aurantiacum]|uniref:UDP-N-acetylglucosamine 2-epimerase n=1 Tax=Aridibaculum aurantiacum TaxID=2810307 RepID=UPI001A96EFD2|nr:UDP-N-acetylglucosamine 2-epimerase [Aridibaculum aurantiacum]
MSKKRKVCVVITARPSYSRIKAALKAIQKHPKLQLQVVLAGPALLNKYGNIENILHDEGLEVTERVYTMLDCENLTSMAKTVGIGVVELSNVFFKLKPHMVVVIADRFETISVSIAAAYQNIPLVHIQGGEITGSIDEKVRHANTKFADIHLVCSPKARKIVMKLGEDPAFVFDTGCPSLDLAAEVYENPQLDFDPYKKYGGAGGRPDYSNGYLVVMQHPVTTEYGESRMQVEETLQAVKELGRPTFWFAPNADAGTDAVSETIRDFRSTYSIPHVHFFNNMVPADFLRLVMNAECLIGNSSMGIRECSFLGVPVINIGTRQGGRERGMNVVDVNHDKDEIVAAVQQWMIDGRPERSFVYGDGNSGTKMAEVLATVPLRHSKKLHYHDEEPVHYSGAVGV